MFQYGQERTTMTVRRINHTGRKRLNQADMRITVHGSGNGHPQFSADLDFSKYTLPEDAQVFVEAYRQTSWMRFDFGTVATVLTPYDTRLSEFDSVEAIMFRVKITSVADPCGVIVAEADRIRPRCPEDEESERRPLLTVKPDKDLGDQLFQVDFSDRPILTVNADVGNWHSFVRDPSFVSLAYPAILREILTRVVFIDPVQDYEDMEDWRAQWLYFAKSLPGVVDPPNGGDEDEKEGWIDEAVASFCRHNRIMKRFGGYWAGGSTQ